VLALAAEYGFAGLNEFEAHYLAPRVAALRDRVTMQLDAEVDQAYRSAGSARSRCARAMAAA